ncbi:MAG: LysR family transcriptional regulator [Eubacterium sp.]|nr:LysR family transcriptional regulator [Eubacterium sp.]
MDIKYLEYLLKIEETGNMARAAESLYLTPSALTQMLRRVEKELGTQLFTRSRSGCEPTAAGRLVLDSARKMINERNNLLRRMDELKETCSMTLRIGYPPDRCSCMFRAVYPEFHEKYPEVQIHLKETQVTELEHAAACGDLDLCFITHQSGLSNPALAYHSIREEELLACIPEENCRNIPSGEKLSVISLRDLSHQRFALPSESSTMRVWQNEIFRQAGFEPEVIFDTSRTSTILSMVQMGYCSTLLPDFYYDPELSGVRFFHLDKTPVWRLDAICEKNHYLSSPEKELIRLTRKIFHV